MNRISKIFLCIASFFGFAGVAFGAFGAHSLRNTLPPELLAVFETAVRYQLYHTFALIAVALLEGRSSHTLFRLAGWCFIAGILLFSGSLYTLTLTGVRMLGLITPFGGLCFLAGWVSMGVAAFKIKKESR